MKKKRKSEPVGDNAEVKITLVPYGYQLDYIIYKGKRKIAYGMRCRDYPGNINMNDAVVDLMVATHKLGDKAK